MSDDHGDDGSSQPPRGLAALAYSGIVVVGLAAVTLAGVAGASDATARVGTLKPLTYSSGSGTPPHSSRTASRKLARRLIGEVRLPPGTAQLHFAKLPPALREAGGGISSGHLVDIVRVYSHKASLSRTFAFISAQHLRGWQPNCCAASYKVEHGKKVYFERETFYDLRRLPAGDADVEMRVAVVPHRGHSWIRVDLQVTWYPRRSAAEHLIASHFRSVTASVYRPQKPHHVTRTFRQRAIIDRLTRVLNSAEASPGNQYAGCPDIDTSYTLRFRPAGHQARVLVSPDGCLSIDLKVGGHWQPALVDSGNVEGLILHLLHLRPEHLTPGRQPIPQPVKP
jgi:hypothetical protein